MMATLRTSDVVARARHRSSGRGAAGHVSRGGVAGGPGAAVGAGGNGHRVGPGSAAEGEDRPGRLSRSREGTRSADGRRRRGFGPSQGRERGGPHRRSPAGRRSQAAGAGRGNGRGVTPWSGAMLTASGQPEELGRRASLQRIPRFGLPVRDRWTIAGGGWPANAGLVDSVLSFSQSVAGTSRRSGRRVRIKT